jgi:hypothetical protein
MFILLASQVKLTLSSQRLVHVALAALLQPTYEPGGLVPSLLGEESVVIGIGQSPNLAEKDL